MIKGFFLGFGLAVGLTFGAIAVVVGLGATAVLVGAPMAGKAVERLADQLEADETAFRDDLEAFRECVLINANGNAVATIEACKGDLATWKQSPTFSAEWKKLMATDAQVRAIATEYNEIKEDYDNQFGRTAVNRCMDAADLEKCVLAQYGE